jgi:hypothetical protein
MPRLSMVEGAKPKKDGSKATTRGCMLLFGPTEGGLLRHCRLDTQTMPCAHAARMGTRQSRRFDAWPTLC